MSTAAVRTQSTATAPLPAVGAAGEQSGKGANGHASAFSDLLQDLTVGKAPTSPPSSPKSSPPSPRLNVQRDKAGHQKSSAAGNKGAQAQEEPGRLAETKPQTRVDAAAAIAAIIAPHKSTAASNIAPTSQGGATGSVEVHASAAKSLGARLNK